MSRKQIIAVVVLLLGVLGLGAYVLQLKRHAEHQEAHATDTQHVAPPVAATPMQVTLAIANDADGTVSASAVSIPLPQDPAKRPKEILRALVARYLEEGSTHPLGPGADINDVYIVGDKLAVVDVNATFADGHRSGILVEELTLASMAQTLASNVQGVSQMKLLVDGKERETLAGHADLAAPYDVAYTARLVK